MSANAIVYRQGQRSWSPLDILIAISCDSVRDTGHDNVCIVWRVCLQTGRG